MQRRVNPVGQETKLVVVDFALQATRKGLQLITPLPSLSQAERLAPQEWV
mgnify:CR=1